MAITVRKLPYCTVYMMQCIHVYCTVLYSMTAHLSAHRRSCRGCICSHRRPRTAPDWASLRPPSQGGGRDAVGRSTCTSWGRRPPSLWTRSSQWSSPASTKHTVLFAPLVFALGFVLYSIHQLISESSVQPWRFGKQVIDLCDCRAHQDNAAKIQRIDVQQKSRSTTPLCTGPSPRRQCITLVLRP